MTQWLNNHLYIFTNSQFVAAWLLVVCCIFLLITFRKYRRVVVDSNSLHDAMRSVLRQRRVPAKVLMRTETFSELWKTFLVFAHRARTVETQQSAAEEIISVGSDITAASDDVDSVASAVAKTLCKEAGSDALASAVVLRGESGIYVAAVEGVPLQRISDPLLSYFDSIFDDDNDSLWGYQIPTADSLYDFSVFDLGMWFTEPLRDENGVCGGVWIGFKQGAQSLTPQKKVFIDAIAKHAAASFYAAGRAQVKQQKSESERDFLLGMSHDLRAPGNSALFALRDLLSGETGVLSPEQHLRLTVAERAIQEQLAMLGDVLDFAKYQKGFLQADKRKVYVRNVIDTIYETFSLSASRENLSLNVEEVPPMWVNFDSRHLQRILSNFLSNAIKYSDGGQITLTKRFKTGYVELLVVDSGIGVPLEEVPHLFEEFRRCNNAQNRQGIGLGLALCNVLATINGGYVFYEPREEGGSIFGVGLPLSETASESDFKLGSVLVVDDDQGACRANMRCLKEVADQLIPASSLEEAIEFVSHQKLDLIVSDLVLGQHSAASIIDLLHRMQSDTPVIIVSGSADENLLGPLRKQMGVSILEKPVSRETLCSTVKQVCFN